MDNFELFTNLTIIFLLVPTIIYVYRLNKSLNALRASQNSLGKLIASLNEATFKAENSIPKLKNITENSSEGLKEVVSSAKTLKDDLMFINQRADGLANRLEGIISDTRSLKPAPGSPAAPAPADKKDTVADERALAEMELLKALRSIK